MTIETGLLAVIAIFTFLRWFDSNHWAQWRYKKVKRAWQRLRHREIDNA